MHTKVFSIGPDHQGAMMMKKGLLGLTGVTDKPMRDLPEDSGIVEGRSAIEL